MNDVPVQPLLDPRERHFCLRDGLPLFLRHLPADSGLARDTVLYVHGATFPSSLSIAHRSDGRSWRDELVAAGFDVWGLDFLGYGGSARYPEMSEAPERHAPLCDADDASRQIERAVRFIRNERRVDRISVIAHSWGSIASGRFAARCPDMVRRLILFGPIARRDGPPASILPAWRLISLQDQWSRFTAEVPDGMPPVLSSRHFAAWGEAYLDSDGDSHTRSPASVKTPAGPWQDIARAWAGDLTYDPADVRAPVMLVRGEWDTMCTDADAAWLFQRFASPTRWDVKISRATHLMHLEAARFALYRATLSFLEAPETVPA